MKRSVWFKYMVLGVLLLFPAILNAQDTPQPVAPAATVTEAAPDAPPPGEVSGTTETAPEKANLASPTDKVTEAIKDETPSQPSDLLTGVQQTVNDWRTLGWLAGVMALLQLLMKILKFGPVDEWFRVNKKKWLKPYIAAGIGAILGGFSTYATGAGVMNSVIAGLMVGITSVGWNELVNKVFQPDKRVA